LASWAYVGAWSSPLVPFAAFAPGPSAVVAGNLACVVLP
jgi:hypothetical protein